MHMSELAAREAIRDLVARYNAFGDAGRIEEMMALFADDARLEMPPSTRCEGRLAIAEFFENTALPEPGEVPEPIWHHTSTLVIDLDDAEHARGSCYFAVLTRNGVDHWGRYRDRYRRFGERWLFSERRVRVDGLVPGGWGARRLERGTLLQFSARGAPAPPH